MAKYEVVQMDARPGIGTIYWNCPACTEHHAVPRKDTSTPIRPINSTHVDYACTRCGQPFFQTPADMHKFIDLFNVAGPQAASGFWAGPEGVIPRRLIAHAAQRWKRNTQKVKP